MRNNNYPNQGTEGLAELEEALRAKSPAELIAEARAREEEKKELEERNKIAIYRIIPPAMDSTGSRSSNVERTGRRDLTVNTWARPIGTGYGAKTDKVRFIDGDLMMTCQDCKRVIVFCEASADPDRAVTFTKKLAESVTHEAYAVKIIHAKNDSKGLEGIKHLQVWLNGKGAPMLDVRDLPVAKWQLMMENIMVKHLREECGRWK